MPHDKPKWQEPLEQWGGHFIALGLIGTLLFGPFNIGLILVRELTDWKWMPWPWKGQWPPGDPTQLIDGWLYGTPMAAEGQVVVDRPLTQLDRVEDMARDLIFQLAGCAVGQAIQLGLLLWLWLS